MKYVNNIILFVMIIISSCKDDSAIKEEFFFIESENFNWMTSDSIGVSFLTIDDNGISQYFSMQSNSVDYNPEWGSIMGINTNYSETEYLYQSYRSDYGINMDISLTAGNGKYGDIFQISLNDYSFKYDLKLKTICYVSTPYSYDYKIFSNNEYRSDESTPTTSTVEILNSYTTNDITYDTVLHFIYKDNPEKWEKYTITDIYYAKSIGLIEYVYDGTISCVRITE